MSESAFAALCAVRCTRGILIGMQVYRSTVVFGTCIRNREISPSMLYTTLFYILIDTS